MKRATTTDKNTLALKITTLIAAAVMLVMFWQFFAAIAVACIMAVIFTPLQDWLTKKTKRKGLAIFLTTLVSILVVVVPIILTVIISVNQVQVLVDDIDANVISADSLESTKVVDSINRTLERVTDGRVELSVNQLEEYVINAARAIGNATINFISSTVSSIPGMVTAVIIYFYVFLALLGNHKKLLQFLRSLNPLGDDVTTLFLDRAKAMTNSMVKGQFVVAIAQGLVGAASLHVAGLGYFSFFALILSLLSIVPLGGGILTIPIGIIMMLFGNISGGLIVLLTHFIIVTNIDNVIRPKLVPEELSLHPALTMISVFAGLALFGFLGIVVGPVLFILALTTLQVYSKVNASS